jgi:hypothetical protein
MEVSIRCMNPIDVQILALLGVNKDIELMFPLSMLKIFTIDQMAQEETLI